jgi:hypothetical protein
MFYALANTVPYVVMQTVAVSNDWVLFAWKAHRFKRLYHAQLRYLCSGLINNFNSLDILLEHVRLVGDGYHNSISRYHIVILQVSYSEGRGVKPLTFATSRSVERHR